MPAARDTLISARENRQMFDHIAKRYDLMNAVMSLGLHHAWRQVAMRFLLSQDGSSFLDIGCGTGDVALAITRAKPHCRVTGIDPSPDMLAIAREKISRAGCDGSIRCLEGDATALPFDDAGFAGIVCAFCLRNIEDRAAALREMRRVLKPGATLAILELTAPSRQPAWLIHALYTRHIIPMMGALLSQGHAYRYLARSIDHFPAPPVIVNEIAASGFHHVEARGLTGGFVTLFTGLVATNPPSGRVS